MRNWYPSRMCSPRFLRAKESAEVQAQSSKRGAPRDGRVDDLAQASDDAARGEGRVIPVRELGVCGCAESGAG